MYDDRNRMLAPVREGADFLVSGRPIGLLMTRIAENRHLADLFPRLCTPEGSEIHLKPASDYVLPGREVTFATVVESARCQGQCAIGYRVHAGAAVDPSRGVRLNPDKRETARFRAGDRVIVLAEDRPPGTATRGGGRSARVASRRTAGGSSPAVATAW
ncbi:hypothetical protein ACLGI4_26385 [Streptomyces sp. HMX112]|uniref:hypothetical protein n=1 Tax=Streptomyces sp. HMX112 TaxID=3390850 RepID=UPI003A807274